VYDPLDLRRAILEAALLATDLQDGGQRLLETAKERTYLRSHVRQLLVESTNMLLQTERMLPPLPEEFQLHKLQRASLLRQPSREHGSPVRRDRSISTKQDLLDELAAIRERVRKIR
jgi:hypothetical protein